MESATLEIRTILAPVDFSERSENALDHAAMLARHYEAKLICAHVVPPAPREYQLPVIGIAPEPSPEYIAEMEKRLRSLLRAAPARNAEAIVLSGDPAHGIERLVTERQVDLVVMAPRGHGRFRRLLLGSVVAKVLHDVECPVLTGAHLGEEPAFGWARYDNVACALGLRDVVHSEEVVRWADGFAKSWSACLHVIHVPPSIDWGAGEWFPHEKQLVREAWREKLDALLSKAGIEAVVHTQGMEAVPYVAEVIREVQANALIVGRSAEQGLLGGGDAFVFARESPCPVVSV